MNDREERIARNEVISRRINEGIEDSQERVSTEEYVRMVCECGQADCERVIAVTIREYEDVRSDPRQFAVAKNHVIPDVERVLRETDRFIVVQKREGTPERVAEDSDPRS